MKRRGFLAMVAGAFAAIGIGAKARTVPADKFATNVHRVVPYRDFDPMHPPAGHTVRFSSIIKDAQIESHPRYCAAWAEFQARKLAGTVRGMGGTSRCRVLELTQLKRQGVRSFLRALMKAELLDANGTVVGIKWMSAAGKELLPS